MTCGEFLELEFINVYRIRRFEFNIRDLKGNATNAF